MALSFEFEPANAISLEEYTDYISSEIDILDQESLAASAKSLYQLSLDKSLMHSALIDPLKDIASGVQITNRYSDAVFLLYLDPKENYFIRANVWRPLRLAADKKDLEEEVYGYERPHDHNFDFVTVGYYGPGYSTRIYEYDRSQIKGEIGEKIELKFLEETKLPTGKVMLYRKNQDVHAQLPPAELSISINLLVPIQNAVYNQQYNFDLEQGLVSAYARGAATNMVHLIELAAEVGREDVVEPLYDIASRNPSSRVKATALASILEIAPKEHENILSKFG